MNVQKKLNPGTKYFPDFNDSILFLEGYSPDKEEMTFKLEQLKQIGVYDKIKGIVVGYVHSFENEEAREKYGIDVEFTDMLLESVKDYDFPILKINEFGHRCQNAFLPIGVKVELDATNKTLEIKEDFLK